VQYRETFVAIGAIVFRFFEKKKVVRKYESLIHSQNGHNKKEGV